MYENKQANGGSQSVLQKVPLIPKTYEYVTLQGKGTLQMKQEIIMDYVDESNLIT